LSRTTASTCAWPLARSAPATRALPRRANVIFDPAAVAEAGKELLLRVRFSSAEMPVRSVSCTRSIRYSRGFSRRLASLGVRGLKRQGAFHAVILSSGCGEPLPQNSVGRSLRQQQTSCVSSSAGLSSKARSSRLMMVQQRSQIFSLACARVRGWCRYLPSDSFTASAAARREKSAILHSRARHH